VEANLEVDRKIEAFHHPVDLGDQCGDLQQSERQTEEGPNKSESEWYMLSGDLAGVWRVEIEIVCVSVCE
jgi:hypothetical protein